MIILMRVLQFFGTRHFFLESSFFGWKYVHLSDLAHLNIQVHARFRKESLTFILLSLYKFSRHRHGNVREIDNSQNCYFITIIPKLI